MAMEPTGTDFVLTGETVSPLIRLVAAGECT